MGAYLSTPVTDKELFDGESEYVRYSGGAMQGWRRTMEDAHIAIAGLAGDPTVSLFGVFDGHGGAEVAKFCQKYMPHEIEQLDCFKEGSIEDCLIVAFHKMDEMLRDSKYAEELESFKTKEPQEEEEPDEDNEGMTTMDALEMLKRVFQLKKLMTNENGAQAPEGEAGASRMLTDDAVTESPDSRVQAGCTAVVALRKGNQLWVANAGDSRGVLCRGSKAVALSEDHKPAHKIERDRIIKAGGFLSEIGGVCRVNGNLNLSRAIGDLKYKSNTALPPKDQIISAQPDVRKFSLTPEDKFIVLACDGVWDVRSNQEVVDFVDERLARNMPLKEVCTELLDSCLAVDPKEARGIGCDNMTVVIVQLKPSLTNASCAV